MSTTSQGIKQPKPNAVTPDEDALLQLAAHTVDRETLDAIASSGNIVERLAAVADRLPDR